MTQLHSIPGLPADAANPGTLAWDLAGKPGHGVSRCRAPCLAAV